MRNIFMNSIDGERKQEQEEKSNLTEFSIVKSDLQMPIFARELHLDSWPGKDL